MLKWHNFTLKDPQYGQNTLNFIWMFEVSGRAEGGETGHWKHTKKKGYRKNTGPWKKH